jgi:tRNA pseudouridine38-40 synthase
MTIGTTEGATRWAAWLEYDGTAYAGWQRQANAPTIQGELEKALATFLGRPLDAVCDALTVVGAGRTDAGVHALGQVAAFNWPEGVAAPDAHRLRRALNGLLPKDIACVLARPVAPDFNPRKHAMAKTYAYRLLLREGRSPLAMPWCWAVPLARDRAFDTAALEQALAQLVGRHDFAAFMVSGTSVTTTTRTITHATVTPWILDPAAGPIGLELRFTGDGFLRGQVRGMVGTLVEIATGKRAIESIGALLASGRREDAGPNAPAAGLCLVEVTYPSGMFSR